MGVSENIIDSSYSTRLRGKLFVSEGVEAEWAAEMEAAAPGFARLVWSPGADEPDYASIEALYFSARSSSPSDPREFAVAALKAENLRWMHTFSRGRG